jgi:predicted amidohydrolase YtcJ
MPMPPAAAEVSVPGFADHHAHLLRASAGIGFPATADAVRDFHRQVAAQGRSPMDVPDPPDALGQPGLASRLMTGLVKAAAAGLVEVTEMGMRSWAYLDALTAMQASRALPLRVRIYLASGLAEKASRTELDSRRADCGPWTRLDGVKFYADGWLVPRTCALCQDFADAGGRGLLFAGQEALARRIAPLAEHGWRIAVHAIGDRAVQEVLDGYELAWAGDQAAIAAAAPRIEHASVLSAELIGRIAESGVIACIQPSFALTDAAEIGPALGAGRVARAYPWAELAAAGAEMLAGSDYPIEVLEPLPGLARLVCGRSQRPGFRTATGAPRQARLPVTTAFGLMTDPVAGRTRLSADPRTVTASQIDAIQVLGTQPVPF